MDFYYLFVLFISEYLIFIIFFIALVLLIKYESKLIQTFLSGFFAGATAETLKYFFPSERPINPFLGEKEGGSFPSSHSSISFGLAFSIFFINKRDGLLLLVFASLVALGRVLSGAHYAQDIIAGAFIGFIWAFVFNKFTYDVEYKRTNVKK